MAAVTFHVYATIRFLFSERWSNINVNIYFSSYEYLVEGTRKNKAYEVNDSPSDTLHISAIAYMESYLQFTFFKYTNDEHATTVTQYKIRQPLNDNVLKGNYKFTIITL